MPDLDVKMADPSLVNKIIVFSTQLSTRKVYLHLYKLFLKFADKTLFLWKLSHYFYGWFLPMSSKLLLSNRNS